MSGPRVSIVLPSKNGLEHLDEAVESVVAQTFKDWELVLVDYGSTDATGERMQAWAARDPRIRAVRLPENRGLPGALNEGFRHARGELFSWTSDDNAYLERALGRMVETFDADVTADAVYADFECFEAEGAAWRFHVGPVSLLPLQSRIGACFLYCRELHEELGGFDESLPLAEDYDFWLRASTRFRFVPLHEVLYRYRLHEGPLTSTRGREACAAAARAMERHLPALRLEQRAHALLLRAQQLFGRGETRLARDYALRALLESPGTALRSAYRTTVGAALFGVRAVRAAARLARPEPPHALRLLLPDYLGGVTSWALNLAAARPDDGPRLELCWIRDAGDAHAKNSPGLSPRADRVVHVDHDWPGENLFPVLRRMQRAVSPGPGVLVASEFFGLAYAARFGGQRRVVQVLHGDLPMYYELAERFEPYVDAFVAVSARIRDELRRRLPAREADIRCIPNGVPIPVTTRTACAGPLRLVYSGRLDVAKGLGDLPEIDRLLRAEDVDVRWTLVGAGPAEGRLREHFAGDPRVRFTGTLTPEEARARLLEQDVLVLPSRGEGLSLALLEAMAAGVVPVASDLPSGMREVIDPAETGLLAEPEQPAAFATAITQLAREPELRERLSRAAAARIRARHALAPSAAAFYALCEDLLRRPVPLRPRYLRGPSQLDRPWLPNSLVRAVRKLAR